MNFFSRLIGNVWTSVACTCVVFLLLILSFNGFFRFIPFPLEYLDKPVHFILFFILLYVWCHVYARRNKSLQKNQLNCIAAAVFIFGVVMEVIQYFCGRGMELGDVAANAAGILAARWILFQKERKPIPVIKRTPRRMSRTHALEREATALSLIR